MAGLVYAGCVDTLYVLGQDLKTYKVRLFGSRKPHRLAEEFIREHNGIAAVITKIGKAQSTHTWGVTATWTALPDLEHPGPSNHTIARIFYFPGALYGMELREEEFVPLTKVHLGPGYQRWVYGDWPAELPVPETTPFSGEELLVPNLN